MIKILTTAIALLLLTGCIGFLTNLKEDTQIVGNIASETVLIIEEDYKYEGYFLPKGIYYPNSQSTEGYVNYIFPEKIKLDTGIFKLTGKSHSCSGGIAVKNIEPYTDYYIFKYYDCGDPYGSFKIPKDVKFKIVPINS